MTYATKSCRWCGDIYTAGVRSLSCSKAECQERNRQDIRCRAYKAPCKAGCGRLAMREGLRVGGRATFYLGFCSACAPRRPSPLTRLTCVRCGASFMGKPYFKGHKRCDDCRMYIGGNGGLTLEMIGQRYGFTRERARQLVRKAELTGLTRRQAMDEVYAHDPRRAAVAS